MQNVTKVLRSHLLLFLFIACSTDCLVAQEREDSSAIDELPSFAICRLGTNQFRTVDFRNYHVKFSLDGKRVMTDKYLWDFPSGNLLPLPDGLSLRSFAKDGRILGAITKEQKPTFIDATDGTELFTMPFSHTNGAAFSPDMKTIAINFFDRKASFYKLGLWDLATKKRKRVFDGSGRSTIFSPDGKWVGFSVPGGGLKVGSTETGQIHGPFSQGQQIEHFNFSPNSKSIAIVCDAPDGSHRHTVELWEIESKKQLHVFSFDRFSPYSAAFSPDGKLLAIAGTGVRHAPEGSISIWDLSTKTKVETFAGHIDRTKQVAFSPNGEWLVSIGFDNVLRRWSLASGKEVTDPEGHTMSVTSVAFSPDGNTIVSGSDDRTFRLWNASTGALIAKSDELDRGIRSVAFASDGETILTGGKDSNGGLPVVAWSFKENQLQHQRDIRIDYGSDTVVYSPDESLIAAAGPSGKIHIWSVDTGDLIRTIAGNRDGVVQIAFSPSGNQLTSVGGENHSNSVFEDTVQVWDVATGENLFGLDRKAAGAVVTGLAYSADGKEFATCSEQGGVSIWNAQSGELITKLGRDQEMVHRMAWSPNEAILAAGHTDGSITLWDTEDRQVIKRLTGHRARITALAFSPNGDRLASGSDDTTVLVWSVHN